MPPRRTRSRYHGGSTAAGEPVNEEDEEVYRGFLLQISRLTDTLTDPFCRNAAMYLVVQLCMRAGDEGNARAIFQKMDARDMRHELLTKYPTLWRMGSVKAATRR